jgi:predicted dinucleotide-binding enzyme
MNIGIIGAGGMGRVLAHKLTTLGHRVTLANSRGPRSLTSTAAETGALAVTVEEAARAGDMVFLAIPTKAVPELPRNLFSRSSPRVIVDLGNYHPELRDGRIDAIEQGMLDSEWVAREIDRPVIKAFNNILAASLQSKSAPRGEVGRIALSVAGDPAEGKADVLRLVDDLGFDPVDAGGLEESFRQQPGTPAYCHDLNETSLRDALAQAVRSRIAMYRAAREAELKVIIAAQASADPKDS